MALTKKRNPRTEGTELGLGERRIDVDATQYAVTSLQLLNSSRERRFHSDFEIRVGDIILPVHKHVLAIRSEYFDALFRAEVTENKAGFINMQNVDADSVVKSIDFIYTGKASVGDGKIGDLLHVAKLLQLHELCDGLVKLMKEDLNESTFFETKQVANMYSLEELEKTCDNFAKKSFQAISKDPKFGTLEKDYVEFLLSSEDTTGRESMKFDALLKWVHYKPGERNDIFPEYLEHLKLERLPRMYYRRLLENEPLVYESASILRKFALCMMTAEALRSEYLLLYDNSSQTFHAHSTTQDETKMAERMLMKSPVSGMGSSGFVAVAGEGNLFILIPNTKVLYTIEYDDPNAAWRTISGMKQTYQKTTLAALDGT